MIDPVIRDPIKQFWKLFNAIAIMIRNGILTKPSLTSISFSFFLSLSLCLSNSDKYLQKMMKNDEKKEKNDFFSRFFVF
jgi:hypothetical protein